MSSFEYTSILASIIVGYALSDMLRGLQLLLKARRRVMWDWTVPLLAALVALSLIQVWWLQYRPAAGPITIGAFLPGLVQLVLLSLLASAVFPDEVPDEGIDLKIYYAENARFLWTIYAAALAWLAGTDIVVLARAGVPAGQIILNQIAEAVIMAVMVSLALVRHRWWHAIGFALLASGPLMWLSRSVG